MTPEEFKPIVARAESWWPGTKWDEMMILHWYEALGEFDAGGVDEAFERLKHAHTQPFAPAIGAVLSLLAAPDSPPSLQEIRNALAAIVSRPGFEVNPVTGTVPPRVYRELGWQLGEFAMDFARMVGAEALLHSELAPGSFERRDLQRELDAASSRFREREASRRHVQLPSGVGQPALAPLE